jgi:hypothetical protein
MVVSRKKRANMLTPQTFCHCIAVADGQAIRSFGNRPVKKPAFLLKPARAVPPSREVKIPESQPQEIDSRCNYADKAQRMHHRRDMRENTQKGQGKKASDDTARGPQPGPRAFPSNGSARQRNSALDAPTPASRGFDQDR